MNQHMTIIRKHVDRYVTIDSCRKGHGIGMSICRVCVGHDPVHSPRYVGKHRAEGPACVGFPRMGF